MCDILTHIQSYHVPFSAGHYMKSHEIRQKFITFFQEKHHQQVPSSSLIPADDPTLLFTNAGMNQFKGIFLGQENRPYNRAVTIQKCMRAGGKHNDLENVGRTTRHLTFFEMLGNFSFGDYFKKEAITYAWEFLTRKLELPQEKLWVTVYTEDQEAYDIWHKEIGLPEQRIIRLGRKDNFWQMGDTGPCGPCSEIYVDKGAATPAEEQARPGDECERFLEVWNLVFMQFNRDAAGIETPLEKTGIDTGMGLERICSILQNVESAFDTDIFEPLFNAIATLSGIQYASAQPEQKIAFRVLSDHIRSSCLVIADGGMPSNEGRGYVIRKIIRRAALFGQKLGSSKIFAQLAAHFINAHGNLYPELITNRKLIEQTLADEVTKFESNLQQGLSIFASFLTPGTTCISGEQAFKLYDTYGFPLELTLVLAQDANYTVDTHGFETAMEEQRKKSGKKRQNSETLRLPDNIPATDFVGYANEHVTTPILTILDQTGTLVNKLLPGQTGSIITPASPCYVESGGQISDQGWIERDNIKSPITTLSRISGTILHTVEAQSTFTVGDQITIHVNPEVRSATKRNHTATHLLQGALISVFGSHIKQAGSSVTNEALRFDFTHNQSPTKEELEQVEKLVNTAIMATIPVVCTTTNYQDALQQGALAFFGDKYNPESVRMIKIADVSTELCGGTHVANTGEIGLFKILDCSALASGIKRITATTGFEALAVCSQAYNEITEIAKLLKTPQEQALSAIQEKLELLRTTEKERQNSSYTLALCKIMQEQPIARNNPSRIVLSELSDARLAKDLKNLAQECAKQNQGVTLLMLPNEKGVLFAGAASDEQAQALLQKIATQLTQQHNLRTTIQKTLLIGGGALPSYKEFTTNFKAWLEQT